MTKTYTFTQPTTELEMYNLMNTFNAMRRSAKKTAIVEGLERMACTHRRIVVDGQVYFFNGQELTHFKGEHDCYLCHDNEIVSTPEQPRSYIIREEQVYAYSTEMHCLVWRPVFRVYDAQDGHPLYIGEYTVEAAEARLRRYHLVSTITVEYAHPAPFNPEPFCQALAMAVAAYIPPFEVCGSWEVDAHFQASRQLDKWQAEHPDVDITPLIFGFFVDDDIEIEDFDLGEPGPREGEEEDLHSTHGPLPEWMYEEQEPHTLSPAPMQQQRGREKYYNPATRAFYRYDKRPEVGDVDTIMFGYYPRDGEQGNTAEMRMSWIWLDTRITPQLRIFDDAWAALTTMQDVLMRLGTLDDAYATPEQIASLLLECGFEERTHE